MISKIRILVVDDSVVVRRMVSDALSADEQLDVVGTAANGKIALARIPQINPDIVILDIEMPELDGLATLEQIRKCQPTLPVIMYSTLTRRGAEATLDALSKGATDYVTKPSNVGSAAQALECIRTQLAPKIKAICSASKSMVFSPSLVVPANHRPALPIATINTSTAPVDIVAVGVSTGGPNALADLIPMLPADFPVPVVIVQHMPPVFTKLLAERLEAKSQIKVEEGAQGRTVQAGHAFIAPGNYHMLVRREARSVRIQTNQESPENSCRPAVDVLFRSVAEAYGAGVLGVVMTGMGQDGLRGSERIRGAGGQVWVQDEATSVVWGMPGFVANAGLADKVLPLQQLGTEIIRKVQAARARTSSAPRATAGSLGSTEWP